MPSRIHEPNYSEFSYRSGLTGEKCISLDTLLGRWTLGDNSDVDPYLTEDDVQRLILSTVIPNPFSTFRRGTFSAPRPIKNQMPQRPANPMYSGRWGQPAQLDIPPEPKITLRRTNLRLFGFSLAPVNRYIDQFRQERATRQLKELRREWDQRFRQTKISNQEAIRDFERRVQDTPEYRAYLADDRRWLEVAAATETEFEAASRRWQFHHDEFVKARNEEEELLGKLHAAWSAGRPEAIEPGLRIALENSLRWWKAKSNPRVRYDSEAATVLIEFEFPDVEKVRFLKEGAGGQLRDAAKVLRKQLEERLIYGLALRVVFDLAEATRECPIEKIALNGSSTFVDRATGHERTETILSLFVMPQDVLELRLSHADPKSAFKKLKGIMTASLSEHSPIIPIMTLDKNDERVVAARDAMEGLAENENLAAMDWGDFEHLIRELFERMFVNNGVEVKVTRASRDSGVDAIAFDPNPLTGGKFVIQAKRYTRTVDVSAVRDLFGTLQNEGANRGILVTTSKFGRDSYEFAAGKPITLIDGPGLLGLFAQHGYSFRIDLEEARREAKAHRP